jgi:hypothetical protein
MNGELKESARPTLTGSYILKAILFIGHVIVYQFSLEAP